MVVGSTNLSLEITQANGERHIVAITSKGLSLGRDISCDVQLEDPQISRIHGFVEYIKGRLTYRDNRSTNGSIVNGESVELKALNIGDRIQLGAIELKLVEDEASSSLLFHESTDTDVTSILRTGSVSAAALAQKLETMMGAPAVTPEDAARMARTLRVLFRTSSELARLLPVEELLRLVAKGVFEVFGGAENLVILLRDEDTQELTIRLACNRSMSERVGGMSVSRMVLDRAIAASSTIVANDARDDKRFAASESLVDFKVKTVICAPLIVAEQAIGALYLDNRTSSVTYDDLDVEFLTAFANQAAIALDNARLCDTLQTAYTQTLSSLVNAIEAKDPYTMGHTQRVKHYALAIAEEFNLSAERMARLGMAAELHDIGKIGVKNEIINKPGALTDTEYEDIKTHVEVGVKILEPIRHLDDVIPWIRGHHERWDGTGYPDGLRGDECPLEARILAAADAFDAMTSQRSYNQPLSFQEALAKIRKASGRHFDPAIVDALEMAVNRFTVPKRRMEVMSGRITEEILPIKGSSAT